MAPKPSATSACKTVTSLKYDEAGRVAGKVINHLGGEVMKVFRAWVDAFRWAPAAEAWEKRI